MNLTNCKSVKESLPDIGKKAKMVTIEEQETVIQWNRSDDYATIYTSDSTTITKLDNLCETAPNNYTLTRIEKDKDGNVVGKFYRLADKKMISLRKNKKQYTEEQKKIMAERIYSRLNNATD